jgi:hypothetical protein
MVLPDGALSMAARSEHSGVAGEAAWAAVRASLQAPPTEATSTWVAARAVALEAQPSRSASSATTARR